jgi:hypothetical protein
MTSFKQYIFLLCLILLFSCEDNRYFTNCDECTADEPFETVLKADLDPGHDNGVIVMLWEGKLEDNILIDSIKVFNTSYEKMVPLNRTFTITATYLIDNKSYTAVDSSTPRVRYTDSQCDEPCYYVYDSKTDLTLKYTK